MIVILWPKFLSVPCAEMSLSVQVMLHGDWCNFHAVYWVMEVWNVCMLTLNLKYIVQQVVVVAAALLKIWIIRENRSWDSLCLGMFIDCILHFHVEVWCAGCILRPQHPDHGSSGARCTVCYTFIWHWGYTTKHLIQIFSTIFWGNSMNRFWGDSYKQTDRHDSPNMH